jgi:hypothetical protein
MIRDFETTLDLMDRAQSDFESGMPTPEFVELPSGPVFRFKEKNIYEALIQKLARVQSSLRAAYILWQHGYYQEQMMLHRMFLVLGVQNEITGLHERFLESFWEEEIDESGDALNSAQKRPMIPRQKIRAFIGNNDGIGNPSGTIDATRTIYKAYSGFVHGASPQIMDMFGGDPPHFHTKGMLGTPRVKDGLLDLWNYMYRSFVSYILFAKIIGAEEHVEKLTEWLNKFEENQGKKYSKKPSN